MASTPLTYTGEEGSSLHSTPIFRPSSSARRTPSFSSASPSDSCDSSFGSLTFSLAEEFPPFSPIGTPLKFKGIPFSWEKLPGIPKNQFGPKKKAYSEHLLPLPPAGTTNSAAKKLLHQEEISPKKSSSRFVQRDPFFAALVECSKDDHDHDEEEHDHHHHHHGSSSKITRTLSDRFGFISMYASCKRTCAVSESLVYLPRPSPQYLLNRRSS
ncbi:UNVERIFIED_CONTAM: hypothetical protein Scaly_1526000 [Sesamum calycinum]|uniref:Uncharacterized protein n=1 Tax=Sesamum calycinum TaxID=2727403 RepID=A0AAW2P748_9LAMI